MGIVQKKAGNGVTFYKLNAKDGTVSEPKKDDEGKFIKGERIVHPSGTSIEGLVTGFEIKEFENKEDKTTKYSLVIYMDDPEPDQPKMSVEATFGSKEGGFSAFGLGLLARLNTADLTKPLAIQIRLEKEGSTYKKANGETVTRDRDNVSLTVWQNRMPCKPLYADGSTQLPPLPRNSKGKVTDTVLWDPIGENLLVAFNERFNAMSADSHGEAEGADGSDNDEGIDVDDLTTGAQVASTARPGFAAR